MKVTTLVLAGALAAFVAAPAQAQQPDFSGTWEIDRGASEIPEFRGGRGGGRGGGPGRGGAERQGGPGGFGAAAATLVITQSSDLLTVEQQTPRGSRSASYRLDGNESTTSSPRGDLVTTFELGRRQPPHRGHDADVDAARRLLHGHRRAALAERRRPDPHGRIDAHASVRRNLHETGLPKG